MDEATAPVVTESGSAQPVGPDGGLMVEEELLVEEISIDGMCGVY